MHDNSELNVMEDILIFQAKHHALFKFFSQKQVAEDLARQDFFRKHICKGLP